MSAATKPSVDPVLEAFLNAPIDVLPEPQVERIAVDAAMLEGAPGIATADLLERIAKRATTG